MIYTFHPAVLLYHTAADNALALPSGSQMLVHLALLFLTEAGIQRCLRRYFIFLPMDPKQVQESPYPEDDDGGAFELATEFLAPRLALLLAVAVVGTPSALGAWSGNLHIFSMSGWLILRQMVGT
jgi:hypothetical protein